MIHTAAAAAAPAVAGALDKAERILLLTHINPDGDAIGSLLGVWHTLRAMGKQAIPLASSALPTYALSLPGAEHIQVYEPGMRLPDADLIWMVDTADLTRVGAIYDEHADELAARPLIIVDHHVTNVGGGQINLIDAQAASCAEVVYRLLREMQAPVSPEAATCLLLGITTDTQSFQTSSTEPRTLRTAADLLEAGADQFSVIQAVYNATPFGTAHLLGLSLSQVQRDNGMVWTHISQEMMQQTGADDGAYDDVVNVLQRLDGVRICVLFKEREDGSTKISLRSKPGIDVAALARTWNGGGHTQAAGATLPMGLDAAQEAVLPVLREQLTQEMA
jgi:phosphoesterase RecJ-like protein